MADYVARSATSSAWTSRWPPTTSATSGSTRCIRLGKALEKYNLAWLEDMIPWQYTELWKKITDAVDIPILTGEDIYLKEPFAELCKHHAVDIIHPDLATSGGILETKKIGDMAQEYGVPMAMHFAGTPVSLHGQRALRRGHGELPGAREPLGGRALVERPGRPASTKPIVNKGFITVPETPGLGITLNDEVVKQHLPSPATSSPPRSGTRTASNDRLWS